MNDNHIGENVGVYTIIELMPYKDKDGHALYKSICNHCNFKRIARYNDLKESKKCVHIRMDGKVSYHKTSWNNKRIQEIFSSMKQRCYNQNDKNYRWYGAKGIKICDQ